MTDDLEQLTYAGRLIPQAIRRWADRWEAAHDVWSDDTPEIPDIASSCHLSLNVIERENRCAGGGQAPGAAPPRTIQAREAVHES